VDRRWLVALVVVCALGLAVLARVVVSPTMVEPAPQPPAPQPPAVMVSPTPATPALDLPAAQEDALAPPEPLVGPDGQPLPPGTRLPEVGLPDRGPPRAPLDDPEAWRGVRADAARAWREESFAVAARFAEEQALSPSEQAGMTEALRTYHDDLEAGRADIEAGRIRPAEGREMMAAIRAAAAADLTDALGPEQMAVLREALSVLPGGGF